SASKISYDFKYDKNKGVIKVSRLVLLNKNDEKIVELLPKKNNVVVLSDVIPQEVFRGCQSDILEIINPYSLGLFPVNNGRGFYVFFGNSYNPVVNFLSHVVSLGVLMLSKMFDGENVNHVSPLRAFPQRYYLLDKTVNHAQLNSADGSELAEILKKNTKITENINLLLAE
ncbi:hypothetical protein B9R35_005024, partial [Escherichia coli]|nr:hypothetical protein [Escherichia coli]